MCFRILKRCISAVFGGSEFESGVVVGDDARRAVEHIVVLDVVPANFLGDSPQT